MEAIHDRRRRYSCSAPFEFMHIGGRSYLSPLRFQCMLPKFGSPVWRVLRRRLCAGVTLFAYLFAAIGFPVSEGASPSGAGSNQCGQAVCCCGTAEQCKTSGCGCSHHIVQQPHEPTASEAEVPSCCSSASEKPAAESSCCSKGGSPAPSANKNPGPSKKNTLRWVVGIAALKCRGGATQWISVGAALPMPAPTDWQPSWPFCHDIPVTHEHPFVIAEDHLVPPPRPEAV